MNGKSHESETDGDHETSNFDRQLDRLVDGELSGLEYREFVKSFDQRPDGWRRCGVAFLEAQAWRQDFLAVRTSESLEPRSSDERRGEERRADERSVAAAGRTDGRGGERRRPAWAPPRAFLRWSSLAASWILALGIGAWWTRPDDFGAPSRGVSPSDRAASQPIPSLAAPAPSMRPFLPAQGAPAQGRNEVEFLMVGDHGDFQESVRMPVLSPEQHAATHDVGRRPVEADVLELLQRAGTDVKKRQEYVPYVLPDGRQILLPVDYVEVKPARTPAY